MKNGRVLQGLNPFGLVPYSLKVALADPQRKSIPRFSLEILSYWLKKKEIPKQYVHKFLYRKGIRKPNEYLSTRQKIRLWTLAIKADFKKVVPELDDKLIFYRTFKEKDIRLPAHIGHTIDTTYHDASGEVIPISGPAHLERVVSRILNSGKTSFFAKPIQGYGGHGVFKVSSKTNWVEFYQAICSGSYLFQEAVLQHPTLAAIYPYSVNTIRIITCKGVGGDQKVHVGCAYIRFGRGGNFVDNLHSGGIRAGVDWCTGKICKHGSEDIHLGGRIHKSHPDTGVKFAGLKIPFFQESVKMAKKAAAHLAYALVGWDIAVGLNGPVLMEGNSKPDHHGSEIADGPYTRNPILGPFIQELTKRNGL
jgi:hypothetical protein